MNGSLALFNDNPPLCHNPYGRGQDLDRKIAEEQFNLFAAYIRILRKEENRPLLWGVVQLVRFWIPPVK